MKNKIWTKKTRYIIIVVIAVIVLIVFKPWRLIPLNVRFMWQTEDNSSSDLTSDVISDVASNIDQELKKTGEDTVSKFLELYCKKDPSAGEYLYGDSKLKYEGFQGLLAETLDYKIIGNKIIDENFDGLSEKSVSVNVLLSNVDVKAIFEELEAESIKNASNPTSEEILERVRKLIKADDAKRAEYNCWISVEFYGTGEKITINSDVSNALTGGLNEYIQTMLEESESNA